MSFLSHRPVTGWVTDPFQRRSRPGELCLTERRRRSAWCRAALPRVERPVSRPGRRAAEPTFILIPAGAALKENHGAWPPPAYNGIARSGTGREFSDRGPAVAALAGLTHIRRRTG